MQRLLWTDTPASSIIWSKTSSLFYTIVNYVFHLTDMGMKVPVGFNIGTILPIPLIHKWFLQFNDPGGSVVWTKFYESMRPYFVSTPVCLGILGVLAAICILLMIRFYNKREI